MKNTLIHGNCLDILPAIPDSSIDMILTDLPYAVTQNKWDQIIDLEQLWKQYKRIIKDNSVIVLTATQPFASQLIMSNLDMFKYDLIWKKNKSSGFLNSSKMPLRAHEYILVFYNEMPIYNPQKTFGHKIITPFVKNNDKTTNYGKTKPGIEWGGSDERLPTSIIDCRVVNNDSPERIHPTQKPIKLFEYLIKTYTNEGMLVLDSCAGSATTAIACINTKRKYICIESDENYYKLASNRIERYKEQDIFLEE